MESKKWAVTVCPERRLDPTAYEALSALEREERRALRAFRPIVYICSPYAGDIDRNIAAARKYSRFAVETGYIPIAPHLLFPQFMNDGDPTERELALFFGNALMSKCSDYRLRYFTEELEEQYDV